jgi:hypothetical protein
MGHGSGRGDGRAGGKRALGDGVHRGRRLREAVALGLEAHELDAAEALLARDLALDRGARAERHGHELADHAVAGVDAVQPRLLRRDQVVLRVGREVHRERVARERVDLADADLDRVRLVVVAAEAQPQRLALVHRDDHAAVITPRLGDAVAVVLHAGDREPAEPGRQRVRAPVVGDPQRADERDGEARAHLQLVAADFNFESGHLAEHSIN